MDKVRGLRSRIMTYTSLVLLRVNVETRDKAFMQNKRRISQWRLLLQCTLNLLTQVNNNLLKYLRQAEIPVGKPRVPGVKTTAKVECSLACCFKTEVFTQESVGRMFLVYKLFPEVDTCVTDQKTASL